MLAGERSSLPPFGIGPKAWQEVFPACVALLIALELWNESDVPECQNGQRGVVLAELEDDLRAVPVR
jgi:hypothetical protein